MLMYAGRGELRGVVAGDHVHFLHGMNIRGLQRAAVGRNSIDGRLHLFVGLSSQLDAIDATGRLHQGQRSQQRLWIAPVAYPGSVVEPLAGKRRLESSPSRW